ncbi:MAG: hypothetical protein JRG86_00570 [Deltaproteobacteria bacterium]|nr:hypothetical protein [Deltaproteobacteria bacterium]MBW2497387.1 hypothetical protein [Deltaproteobacteria bacterium]
MTHRAHDTRRSNRRPIMAMLVALLTWCAAGAGHTSITEGDRAWAARAETLDQERADPARIQEAIAHYRAATESDPDALEPGWKLLRALHYAIDFTTLPDDEKDARMREAVDLARAWGERTSDAAAPRADVARMLFWSAIAWGTRAQRVGLLTIVREGVATRMHDDALRSLELDPSVDRGGALRLLSRLHATLPRVPFVSGWVDRKRALLLAERGYALDPEHPGNRLVLALVLLEREPSRRDEARALLESVAEAEPRADALVEDLRIREQARDELARIEGGAS